MKNTMLIGLLVLVVLLAGGALFYKYQKRMQAQPQPVEQGRVVNTVTPQESPPANISEETNTDVQNFDSTNKIALTVSAPANNAVVKTPNITVLGVTLPNSDVSVNDKDVKSDAQGNFSAMITLDEGINTIIVVANDAQGNASEKDISVTYDTGQTY